MVYLYVLVFVCHVWVHKDTEEGMRSLEDGFIDSCNLLDVHSGNCTLVIWKSSSVLKHWAISLAPISFLSKILQSFLKKDKQKRKTNRKISFSTFIEHNHCAHYMSTGKGKSIQGREMEASDIKRIFVKLSELLLSIGPVFVFVLGNEIFLLAFSSICLLQFRFNSSAKECLEFCRS